MASLAKRMLASLLSTPITSYDQDKWNLPTLMKQRLDLSPKSIGPLSVSVARPVETGAAIPGYIPAGISWSDIYDYLFLADNAAAAATRRIQMFTFDKRTSTWGFNGYITLTLPFRTSGTSVTIRGFEITYDKYIAGTASTNGTAVTGVGTAWQASRLAVGSRIGFGSNDPTQIATWYEISAIGGDGSITLTSSAGVQAAGPYVIEEWRVVMAVTNATPANGSGLFIAKGLRPELFVAGGTTIAAAVSTDNVRAVYWCSDGAAQSNTVPSGLAYEPRTDWTTHYVYISDNTSNVKWTKYNLRAALVPASGVDPGNSFTLATAAVAVTGTAQVTNCCCYAQANHGPASGLPALYFVTSTRIYCCLKSAITSGGGSWQSYLMTEVPPGSVNTFGATSAFVVIEYDSMLDRFVVITSGATSFRPYITQFRNDAGQMDHIFLVNTKQIDQAAVDGTTQPHHAILEQASHVFCLNGIYYLVGIGITAATNLLHATPVGADWQYGASTGQRLITPRFPTPNNSKFSYVATIDATIFGGVNLGLSPETFRLYYRTSGISDNSGAWTLVPEGGDLSSLAGASYIQFAIEFRIIAPIGIPAKIYSVIVVYEDMSTDSHYQPSASKSDSANKRFAWRFATAFGGNVPPLRVQLFDAITLGQLVDDNTSAPTGTFEKSTDGGQTWVAWTNADKGNETTYLRYTPNSLGDNIRVRYLLTLL